MRSLPLASLLVASALLLGSACGESEGSDPTTTPSDGSSFTGDVQFGGDLPPGAETAVGADVTVLPDTGPPPQTCTTDAECSGATPYCGPLGKCVECLNDGQCEDGTCAEQGVCLPDNCTVGDSKCVDNVALWCEADGTGWNQQECLTGICVSGECTLCKPNAIQCDYTLNAGVQCSANGADWVVINQCSQDDICVDGQCLACAPGALQCDGSRVLRCNGAGGWEIKEDCGAAGQNCFAGKCVDVCQGLKDKSNAGCDYWAIQTDNISFATNSPNFQYSVVIANFSDDDATVTIFSKDGPNAPEIQVASGEIQPNQLEVFDLPQRKMAGAGVWWKAYRIRATAPIVAYQFNPLENVEVYSNDASLLIPTNTYGKEYMVVSRPEITGSSDLDLPEQWRGFASVVAREDGTTVTVKPTVRCQAGNGVQAMNAGSTYTFQLERYQVLNIKSDQGGGDLTGTSITADKAIGVFSGHDAVASSQQCCADHLEHQLFPVETWGQTYVAAKSWPRSVEKDYWRIVAAQDGTQITFQPEVSLPQTLNRGQFYEFATKESFVVSATKPVSVAQTLASSFEVTGPPTCTNSNQCAPGHSCEADPNDIFGSTMICLGPTCSGPGATCPSGTTCACDPSGIFCGCEPVGDPALILAAPVEQFRDEYIFLSPSKYRDDYISVIAPSAATVRLDGNQIPPGNFKPVIGTDYKVGQVKVTDGVHRLTASEPVGLLAYGYDDDVSYGYTGGLNLKTESDQ